MNGFVQLLKKDWRLNRAPLITLFLSVVGPYLFVAYLIARNTVQRDAYSSYSAKTADLVGMGAVFGLTLLGLVAAVFGGNAFSTERRERWADFLALLPVSRWQILLSKLLIAMASLLIAWSVHCLVFRAAGDWMPLELDVRFVNFYAGGALAMFCLAWSCSTMLQSAAISSVAGIVIFLAAVFVYAGTLGSSPIMQTTVLSAIWIPGILLAIVCSIFYCRRVEP